MSKTLIIYGSSTNNTENVAKSMAKSLDADLINVANCSVDKIANYTNLIFGTSTWGLGDLQDDWDSFLPQLQKIDLSGKIIALFGLGDSASYPDTFVDGMGIIYETIVDKGCKIVGSTPIDGYSFDASRAVVDGQFIGLPLDEDNDSNLTKMRVENWLKEIRESF